MSSEMSADRMFQKIFVDDSFGSMQNLPGDFYAAPDDVVVGMTLPCLSPDVDKTSSEKDVAHLDGSMWFHLGHTAPVLTNDIKTRLTITTLWLNKSSAIASANTLINIFTHMEGARLNKVNQRKFTMRVEVTLEGLRCDVKLRIYQQGHTCVVEFQRRSGDTIIFNWMYRYAQSCLQVPESGHCLTNAELQVYIPKTTDLSPEEAVAPLLNLIESSSDPDMFPEARAELQKHCSQSALREREHATNFGVAFPASQFLLSIRVH